MRKAALLSASLILIAFCFGCGGGTSTQSNTPDPNKPHQRSGLSTRAFVSNTYGGVVQMVDYTKDELSPVYMSVDSGPTFMLPSPDQKTTLVYNSLSQSLSAISNNIEQSQATQPLNGASDSIVVAPDNKLAYAAVRNYLNASGEPGAVQVVDYTQPAITKTIPVPSARWLAIDHAGKRLLVMNDVSDLVYSVDLTASAPTCSGATVASPTTTCTVHGGFSRPVTAFFSTDDTKAWIVNCGPECGGASPAAVQEFTFATGAVRSVAVSAASAATVNGSTMYVAGAPAGVGGTAQTVDLSAMTASAATTIGPGTHTKVVWAGNKVWVAAKNCGAAGGCLSVYDPANASSVLIDTVDQSSTSNHTAEKSRGDVTGMGWIATRNIMYVAEGGELLIYDTANAKMNCPANSTNAFCPIAPMKSSRGIPLDIVGQAWDVLVVPD